MPPRIGKYGAAIAAIALRFRTLISYLAIMHRLFTITDHSSLNAISYWRKNKAICFRRLAFEVTATVRSCCKMDMACMYMVNPSRARLILEKHPPRRSSRETYFLYKSSKPMRCNLDYLSYSRSNDSATGSTKLQARQIGIKTRIVLDRCDQQPEYHIYFENTQN